MINIDSYLLGQRIKEIRLDKNMSIKELAESIDVTSSLLSQIERGLANPSLNTLRNLADSLNIPMFSLFVHENTNENNAVIVRKDQRIRILAGTTNSNDIELGYDLLSPDLKGSIQMCEMVLGPKMTNSETPNAHNGEEVAVCIEGTIELILNNKAFILEEGDSVRIEKGAFHKWNNPSNKRCVLIFSITPPIF